MFLTGTGHGPLVGGRVMSGESVAALAAAGGLAVVQAAGTDAWAGVRRAVARLLGRGNPEQEALELERLDRTENALVSGGSRQVVEAERLRWEGVWQTRLEALFENCPPAEAGLLTAELQHLLAGAGQSLEATSLSGEKGVMAGRDMSVRADRGSVAGGAVHVEGGVRLEGPFRHSPREGSH